eukprot:635199-Prorocentrum_lima.AAC.1
MLSRIPTFAREESEIDNLQGRFASRKNTDTLATSTEVIGWKTMRLEKKASWSRIKMPGSLKIGLLLGLSDDSTG